MSVENPSSENNPESEKEGQQPEKSRTIKEKIEELLDKDLTKEQIDERNEYLKKMTAKSTSEDEERLARDIEKTIKDARARVAEHKRIWREEFKKKWGEYPPEKKNK